MENFLDKIGLLYLWYKVKARFISANDNITSSDAGKVAIWENGGKSLGKGYTLGLSVPSDVQFVPNASGKSGYILESNGTSPVWVENSISADKELKEDQSFLYRKTANGSLDWLPNNETIKKLKGNSLVWNQIAKNGINTTLMPFNYYTFTESENGMCSVTSPNISATTTLETGRWIIYDYDSNTGFISGHKYYIRLDIINCSGYSCAEDFYILNSPHSSIEKGKYSRIVTYNGSNHGSARLLIYNSTEGKITVDANAELKFTSELIDLTLMFGAGNEPSSAAEFEKLFPNAYYDYEPGRLLNFNGTSLETVGFNQWDEEWELGEINSATGQNENNDGIWRTKNYIRILPKTDYYITFVGVSSSACRARFYDINKNYIGYNDYNGSSISSNIVFNTPQNAYYIRLAPAVVSSGTKTCINLSDPKRNGTYEPYQKSSWDLNVSSITGKLNGTGNSVVIFPDGLKSAYNITGYPIIRDELDNRKCIKRIGSIDLGSLSWGYTSTYGGGFFATIDDMKAGGFSVSIMPKYNKFEGNNTEFTNADKVYSTLNELHWGPTFKNIVIKDSSYSDAASFKTAMSGVKLYYELATPEEYILDNEFYPICNSDRSGTEAVVPANGAVPYTSPIVADIQYNGEASEVINSVSENNTRINDIDSRLEYVEDNAAYKGTLVSGNLVSWDGEKLIDSDVPIASVVTSLTLNSGTPITPVSNVINIPTVSTSGPGLVTTLPNDANKVLNGVGSWVSQTAEAKVNLNGTNTTLTTSVNIYAPSSAGTSGQYLKSSGSGEPTWSNLPTVSTANAGIVASLPTSSATSKYLRGDNTWVTPYSAGSNISITGNNNAINALGYSWDSTNSIMSVTGKVNASQGFFEASDIRKKNILGDLDLNKAYDLIDKCQTIIYTLKDNDQKQIGLIAQEVKEFFPEIISEDESGMLSLDYSRLTVVILKVLKDLINRVSKLENYGLGN